MQVYCEHEKNFSGNSHVFLYHYFDWSLPYLRRWSPGYQQWAGAGRPLSDRYRTGRKIKRQKCKKKKKNQTVLFNSLGSRFHKICVCMQMQLLLNILSYTLKSNWTYNDEILEKASQLEIDLTVSCWLFEVEWSQMTPHCMLFSIYFCKRTGLQTKDPQKLPLQNTLKPSSWKTLDLLSAGGRYFLAGSPHSHRRWWWKWGSPRPIALQRGPLPDRPMLPLRQRRESSKTGLNRASLSFLWMKKFNLSNSNRNICVSMFFKHLAVYNVTTHLFLLYLISFHTLKTTQNALFPLLFGEALWKQNYSSVCKTPTLNMKNGCRSVEDHLPACFDTRAYTPIDTITREIIWGEENISLASSAFPKINNVP